MIHPDDAHCYPVCQACRVADVCHKGPPSEVIAREHPRPQWAPNTLPVERLQCGCLGLPWPVIKAFGTSILEVLCDRHGWTKIARHTPAKKSRKTRPEIPGQRDFPPF